MMNLDSMRNESEDKESVQAYLGSSLVRELKEISEKEKVRFSILLRHIFNKFIEEYRGRKE